MFIFGQFLTESSNIEGLAFTGDLNGGKIIVRIPLWHNGSEWTETSDGEVCFDPNLINKIRASRAAKVFV